MNFPLALAVNNGTLIGAACIAIIVVAVFWLFGRR